VEGLEKNLVVKQLSVGSFSSSQQPSNNRNIFLNILKITEPYILSIPTLSGFRVVNSDKRLKASYMHSKKSAQK
jgi:hypothetical protein